MRGLAVRYHVLAALVNLRPFAPILLLLYTDRGLDLAQVAWLQAWFSVVVIAAEVPSGFEVLMSTAITMRSLAAAPARLAATVLSLMMAARRIVYALLMLGVGERTVRYGVASAARALAGLSALTLVLLAGG